MRAKEIFLQKAEIRKAKHPKTAPKIISFSLGVAFFALAILCTGIGHGLHIDNITQSWVVLLLLISDIIFMQGAIVFSAIAITSTRYTLHSIAATIVAVGLAMDIAMAVYYGVWVI